MRRTESSNVTASAISMPPEAAVPAESSPMRISLKPSAKAAMSASSSPN